MASRPARPARGRPQAGSRSRSAPGRRDNRPTTPRRAPEEPGTETEAYRGPPLPDDITGRELDPDVRQQLRSLPDRLAARVARHLVAAGRLLQTDPEAAYQHALAARARAGRLAVVREATGETAYLAGHYAKALAELRAARRMNGAPDFLPLIADCERALGRPDRALALLDDPAARRLDQPQRIELLIVGAGARLDLGQPEAALRLLDVPDLHRAEREPWAARLRYAYAQALLSSGRREAALEWFHRAAAADSFDVTDAAERLRTLEQGGDGAAAHA